MREVEPSRFWLDLEMRDLEGEQWKDVDGFERKYMVSNMGRIKVLNKQLRGFPAIMRQTIKASRDRYCMIQFYKCNRPFTFTVHRLVAKAFLSNPSQLPEVNHKQGIKTDNRASQLEWCTRKQNVRHAAQVLFANCGTKHFRSKFTPEQVKEILSTDGTHRAIAERFGVSHSVIGFIKRRESYKNIDIGTNR